MYSCHLSALRSPIALDPPSSRVVAMAAFLPHASSTSLSTERGARKVKHLIETGGSFAMCYLVLVLRVHCLVLAMALVECCFVYVNSPLVSLAQAHSPSM